jgi:hypothetical protein
MLLLCVVWPTVRGYTAVVAEVMGEKKRPFDHPVRGIAFDCGPQLNPERVRSQLEGAVVMGVSLAIPGEITFKRGGAQQRAFAAVLIASSKCWDNRNDMVLVEGFRFGNVATCALR